jgi:release factor glutamine methyltransferase
MSNERPELADKRDLRSVYQPAEDSRLLAETAIEAIEDDSVVLDLGTGSGYVAARLEEETGARVVGSDLNPGACRQTREAGTPVVRANLLDPFQARVFDAVVCNPPYLPTPPDHEWDDWMERALSGGADGRAVIDPLLADVGRVLASGGSLILLVSSLTDPAAVRKQARTAGLQGTVLAEESHPFETLFVFQFEPS